MMQTKDKKEKIKYLQTRHGKSKGLNVWRWMCNIKMHIAILFPWRNYITWILLRLLVLLNLMNHDINNVG